MKKVRGEIKDVIIDNAVDAFDKVFKTAEEWLSAIENGVIAFSDDVEEVAGVLKDGFELGEEAMMTALDGAGYAVEEIGNAMDYIKNNEYNQNNSYQQNNDKNENADGVITKMKKLLSIK